MDIIMKYLAEIVCSILIMIVSYSLRKVKCHVELANKEQEALKMGMQALLRDRIIQAYNKHIEQEYIPIYANENVNAMYEQYKLLGGNGTVKKLMEELSDLPTKPKKEHD